MAINAIQAAIRSMTGTELQFTGDLHAYWDQLGIPPGQFAERMVAWKQLPQNAAWIAATEDADAAEVVDGLWQNGEQGVRFEAGDLATMFQDAAGTLPVYAPGQGQADPPVGLLLDKRKGLVRGPELLTNGDFSAGAANWAVTNNDATHSATFASGALRFKVDSLTPALTVSQPSVLVPGRWYEVTVAVNAWTSGTVKTDVFAQASAVLASGTGTFTTRLLAVSSVFSFTCGTPTVDLTIDSISIRELSGNHAYQTTTTSRPTLSARYNGFLASEKFDDPYWTWQASFTSQKTSEITDPSGGFDAWKITSTNANATLSRTGLAGFRNPVFTMVAKAGIWTPSIMIRNATTAVNMVNAPLTSGDFTNSYGKYSARDLGGGWKEMKIEITSGVAVTDVLIAYLGATGAIPVGQYMYLLRADFRESGDGVGLPPYQRVVDASTYDTVGFPLYLKFDGVDDWLQTASIDFTTTDKVIAATALRKLSDAAVGMAFELSTTAAGNNGAFFMAAPITASVANLYWRSNGTMGSAATSPSAYPAPISSILTGLGDVSGDKAILRVNGSQVVQSLTDQGAGAYGNYPLYIGRRGGTSLPFNGRIYGLLIRGAATPDTTIAKIEGYLNSKARIY